MYRVMTTVFGGLCVQNDLVHGWGLDMSLQRCAQVKCFFKEGFVFIQFLFQNFPMLEQCGTWVNVLALKVALMKLGTKFGM